MSGQKLWLRSLSLIVSLLLITVAAAAERKVIGKWLDKVGPIEQQITIEQEGEKFYRTSTFHDGSSSRSELVEVKAKSGEKQRFKDPKSGYGESYAIKSDGNLALYDSEGFIREAKKIQ